jgi:predicted TIM-barrel fold metal-dependent hydrolase
VSEIVVDTHAHIYDADEARYPMIDEPYRPPAGTGDAAHLERERERHGIHRVLDHCAYPDGTEGPDSDTVRQVVHLARHANLHAKLTFLVTGSQQAWSFPDTQAIARRILDAFRPQRCMWGSDFPTELWLKGATDYAGHLAAVRDELGLAPAERAEVLGGTAMRLFFPTA